MKATPSQIASFLREVAALVEAGDSFEGRIEWCIPRDAGGLPCDAGGDQLELTAAYRVGNLQGQGGMRIIKDTSPGENVHADPGTAEEVPLSPEVLRGLRLLAFVAAPKAHEIELVAPALQWIASMASEPES